MKIKEYLRKIFNINSGYLNCESEPDILRYKTNFYHKQDLVYFPHLKAYGVFKYEVVKDLLSNNKDITVSNVHIALNSLYFSLDEAKHLKNKKAAIDHLKFLSKSLQNEDNKFTQNVFTFLFDRLPIDKEVDLRCLLVNPLIFINTLKNFGFLQYMNEFNPDSIEFDYINALENINSFYDNSEKINEYFLIYLNEKRDLPDNMQQFLSDIHSDNEFTQESMAQFLGSMIFSATHSTSSFLTSLIFTVIKEYESAFKLKKLKQTEVDALINEVLRIYMPVQWIYRTVRKATTYRGVELEVGDTLIVFIGSANMDPGVFESPELIDLSRKAKHISFGIGPYACIGKYSTFRNAHNLLKYLSKVDKKIDLVSPNEKHEVYNSILRLNLTVKLSEA